MYLNQPGLGSRRRGFPHLLLYLDYRFAGGMEKEDTVSLVRVEEEPFAFIQLTEEKFGLSDPTLALNENKLWVRRVRDPGRPLLHASQKMWQAIFPI